MAGFIADEIIRIIRREPATRGPASSAVCDGNGDGKREGRRPGCAGQRSLPFGPAVEAACVVFLGKLSEREPARPYKTLSKHDKQTALDAMHEAIKTYLRIARKNAEQI